ncbi:MAG: hypothetical protein QM706_17665 [Nitrospira sp.]
MALSGIYAIEVFLNNTMISQGVAVVTEQSFYGVDGQYFCKGMYAVEEHKQIHASVEISSHTGINPSMRGRRGRVRFDLRGALQEMENVTRFTGLLTTDLSRTILVSLRKMSGLLYPITHHHV